MQNIIMIKLTSVSFIIILFKLDGLGEGLKERWETIFHPSLLTSFQILHSFFYLHDISYLC